jgi:hypothetical protein
VEEGEEVIGAAIIACGEPSEVLELVETALDAVSEFVLAPVVFERVFADGVGRNDRFCADGANGITERAAVVGGIGKNAFGFEAFDHRGSLDDIVFLSGRKFEAQRSSQRIRQHMDFGRQSSSGTPQSLVARPPFPVAAC